MIYLSRRVGPHSLTLLDPVLIGYYYRCDDGRVTVPVIGSREQGKGHVRAFLDGLPTDTRIEFCCVISRILAGALARRGFRPATLPVPELGTCDDLAWVRDPTALVPLCEVTLGG